MADEISWN